MPANISELRQEVQRCVDAALALADTKESATLASVERALWQQLLVLGRALVTLFLAQRAQRPRAASYEHGGQVFEVRGERESQVGTLFGKVPFRRPVGRGGGRRRRMDDPVAREVGLATGFSLPTILVVGRLCAQMAFAGARENFEQTHGWTPSPRAVLRMVDGLGPRAAQFLEQAPAPEEDGEILVVEADGKGAPMIGPVEYDRRAQPRRPEERKKTRRRQRRERRREHPRERLTSGKKSKNAKVAVVGVVYTLRRTKAGLEGPINKRLVATFEGHDALGRLLRREADKRGYGKKRTIFLGDGSEHIWRLQAKHFPNAESCIDWFHVVEKLWDAGRCFHTAGSEPLKRWVDAQRELLRQSKGPQIIAGLQARLDGIAKTGPGNKWRRDLLTRTITYLNDHAERMPYKRFREQDLDIGTGAVEGAVRNLVGVRFDGPGMRWGRGRSEALLQLRCILLNKQWAAFMQWMDVQEPLRLAAQPVPAVPYAAKAAA
jgi:hypothetical protein